MTRKQLLAFIAVRNSSSDHNNLAFVSDARFAGHFDMSELGLAKGFTIDNTNGYEWRFQCDGKPTRLIEFAHRLYADFQSDKRSREIFNRHYQERDNMSFEIYKVPKGDAGVNFTVEGHGSFPVDMLRYDNCAPLTERDSHLIELAIGDEAWMRTRRVVLHVRPPRGDKLVYLTPARWRSFGWTFIGIGELRNSGVSEDPTAQVPNNPNSSPDFGGK